MKIKRKRKIILLILLLFVLTGAGFYKLDGIYRVLSTVKTQVSDRKDYAFRNREKDTDLTEYPEIEDNADAWYKAYHVISHSGGV